MFHPKFHTKMKDRRKARSLTQVQSAAECGIKRSRWSDLERGARTPTHEERHVISRFLTLGKVSITPRSAHRTLLDQAARNVPSPPPFFPSQDRPTHVRFCSCAREYPELVDALLMQVMVRDDLELCEYFCHNVSCDSKLEALHLLHLIARGAIAGLLAPVVFGHTRWPIVSCDGSSEVGNRPRPCLLLDGTCYFFQVSFATPQVKRVDILCWKDGWSVLEINGKGHDPSHDSVRVMLLNLTHAYLSEEQLLRLAGSGLGRAG